MIPIYKPYFTDQNLAYAHDALQSTWVSSNGRYLELATEALKEMLGVKHVLLTANGTVANHLMVKVLRLHTRQSKVLVPSNAYVAAWNPFLYENFFRLHPVDMDLDTWNADLTDQLHKAENLLIVHNLGNVQAIDHIKKKFTHLNIVEDACEAFGGYYSIDNKMRHAGTASLCGTFSFYGNKNITSGEGGAFVTNSDEAFEYAKHIWGQAQDPLQKFIHTDVGYNYRMTNVQAAILYGQLQSWDHIHEKKKKLFTFYDQAFADKLYPIEGVVSQKRDDLTIHSNWMYGIRIFGSRSYLDAKKFFESKGIETRPFFYPINYHKHLKRTKNYVNGTLLSDEVVVIPSYPELIDDFSKLYRVVDGVRKYAELCKDNIL